MRRRSITHWLLVAGLLCGIEVATAGDHLHSKNRASLNVPPIDELEILDPRVDSEGKPRSQIVPGMNGLPQIDVPATVIVHRYYYTGDRDFQGPLLQGGPTLLAVNDPAIGEQIYAEVLLPPGAPRITYRSDRIIYEYPDRSITVRFGHPGPLGRLKRTAKPVISIRHHSSHAKIVAKQREQKQQEHQEWWTRTGIPHAADHVVQSSKQATHVAADAIHTVGERATAPVVAIWKATPLSSLTATQEKQPAFNETGVR